VCVFLTIIQVCVYLQPLSMHLLLGGKALQRPCFYTINVGKLFGPRNALGSTQINKASRQYQLTQVTHQPTRGQTSMVQEQEQRQVKTHSCLFALVTHQLEGRYQWSTSSVKAKTHSCFAAMVTHQLEGRYQWSRSSVKAKTHSCFAAMVTHQLEGRYQMKVQELGQCKG